MFYSCIFLYLVVASLAEISNLSQCKKNLLYYFSYVLLMLVASLRYETGGDWVAYTPIFEQVESLTEVVAGRATYYGTLPMEGGYKLLMSGVKLLSNDVQLLYFIVGLIISTIFFKAIPIYSPLRQMSVLVYFGILYFSLEFGAIRQAIALMIVLYAYQYIVKRSFGKYFLYVLLAFFFHRSAILMLPVYFVAHRYFSSRTLIIWFVCFLVIFVLRLKWLSAILTAGLSLALDPHIASKIVTYTTNDIYAGGRGFSLGLLVNVVLFVVFLLARRRLERMPYFNLFLNLFMMYMFVYFAMSELVEISNRLKYYFMISLVVLLPMLVEVHKYVVNKVLIFMGVCGFSFMYCYSILLERPIGSAYNPYQNYLIYKIFNKKSTGLERLRKSDEAFTQERQ